MFKQSLSIVLILSTFLYANKLQSQEIDKVNLSEIIVTSSRIDQKSSETGKHISILSSKEIEELPATSVDELLRYVTGVETQSRYGFGTQADISMRGSTFSQVLILVDGVRLNDPLTGHFNHHVPLAFSDIKQIEILRGPAAAQFGPDAVGGVINIISKTFSNNFNNEGINSSGKLLYGANQSYIAQAGISFTKEKFKINVGVTKNKSDGETLNNPNHPAISEDSLYNAFFDVQNVSFSAAYKFNDKFSLKLRSAFDLRDFSAKYFYTRSTYDESVETVEKFWNQLQLSYAGAKSYTTADFIYQKTTDDFVFNTLFTPNSHTTDFGQFQLNHNRNLTDGLKLNIGGQIDQRKIESNDRGNHDDLHAGIFAMLGWKLNNKTNLTFGLRGDQDDNYGFELNPQLNVAHSLNKNLILRASGGRSNRAADYTERFISNNLPSLSPGRNLGNPNLNAEKAWSGEVGVDYYADNNFTLRGTVFGRTATDVIDYVLTNSNELPFDTSFLAPNSDYFFTKNLESVNTVGFELESFYNVPLSNDLQLKLNAGYIFINSFNDEEVLSKYIANHAKHKVNFGTRLNHKRFSWLVQGLWKNRNSDLAEAIGTTLESDYFVVNTQADINLFQKNIWGTLQVQNVFDKEYADILGSPMPGRWWMLGVRWNVTK